MEKFTHNPESNFNHTLLIERIAAATSVGDMITELDGRRNIYADLFSGETTLDKTIQILAEIDQLISKGRLAWAEDAVSNLPIIGGLKGKILQLLDGAEKSL